MLATLLATTALLGASDFPETFPVPAGSQPEGIASGRGNVVYAGSRANGSVFKANVRTGGGRVLVAPRTGRGAYGLKRAGNRLFVAGGPTGFAYVYDAHSGKPIRSVNFEGGFINDVTVTDDAAYFTDSRKPQLYVIERGRGGDTRTLPLTGQWDQGTDPTATVANGIAATADGRWLVVVATNTGKLFRVNPRTGSAREIDLGGAVVTNGDGILLEGRTLFVVRNRLNQIATVELNERLTEGTVAAEAITDADFDVPTTIARVGNDLYAVNARFGTPMTPETTYSIVKVG